MGENVEMLRSKLHYNTTAFAFNVMCFPFYFCTIAFNIYGTCQSFFLKLFKLSCLIFEFLDAFWIIF